MKPCLEDAFPIQNRDVSIYRSFKSLFPPRKIRGGFELFVVRDLLNEIFVQSYVSVSLLDRKFRHSALLRSLSTLSDDEELLLHYLEIDVSTTLQKFFKKKCYRTFQWLKVKTPRKLSSSVTWFIDYY